MIMELYYHKAIIELLGIADRISFSERSDLFAGEERQQVTIPASYREWCALKIGEPLLKLFSNMDRFYLASPKIRVDNTWGLCAEFMSENQSNFDLAVVLDGSEDPCVIFTSFDGKCRQYTQHFSDYVFAQIFDWQFRLEEVDPIQVEGAGMMDRLHPQQSRAKMFEVRYTEDLLDQLSIIPNRGPTTSYNTDDQFYTEHRFWRLPDARLLLTINESLDTALIQVFGTESINPLYAHLKDCFSDRITKIIWEPIT
jgi:hypothetical protein